MKNFALIGAAGFVAPRHMKAITETGHRLVAAFDPNDSVGIIDSYAPDARFFTEFERFDRHVDKLHRQNRDTQIDYVSVCSPNYLHDSHVRFALRSGADAICEKPVVLNPWNIDGLREIERDTGRRVNTILPLRLHPAIIGLRDKVRAETGDRKHEVDLTYITGRGRWYLQSWKGDNKKSGGIATNIGVHFFDMLAWVFGGMARSIVHLNQPECAAGTLDLRNARVRWFLSINADHLPAGDGEADRRTYRSITVDGREVEFSDGFADLPTVSYEQILSGKGYGLDDARTAVEIVHDIRNASPAPLAGDYHPLCQWAMSN